MRETNHAIFLGKVLSVSYTAFGLGQDEVVLEVEEAFRGVSDTRVMLRTNHRESFCGFPFEKGKRYVVYAHSNSKGELSTDICQRTRAVEYAKEDLAYLRSLPTLPPKSWIYGTVKRYTYDRKFVPRFKPSIMDHYRPPEEEYRAMAPMVGQKIVIEPDAPAGMKVGSGKRHEVIVDSKGNYELRDIEPGIYQISVIFPRNLQQSLPRPVVLVPRGCAREDFRTGPMGRISGKLTGPEGWPLKERIPVQLIYADEGDNAAEQFRSAFPDDQGRFEFESLPAGEYLVGISIAEDTKRYRRYPTLFFPGAKTAARAKVIKLADAEEIEGIELILPPKPD
jgi:hypothetical protein